MLEWPEERRNPIDGTELTHDWDIGYWARYRNRPIDTTTCSFALAAGWDKCNDELKEEAT